MPINSEGNTKSKQGKANQCPDRIFQVKGPVGKIQVGTEDHLFVFAKDHIHFKLFGRSMKTPVIFNIHSNEGGDMEFFVKIMLGIFIFKVL